MRTFDIDTAPINRDGLQQRRLAQQRLGQIGQKAKQRRTFQDPTAERVDHRHRSPSQHLDEADDAETRVGPQVEGIDVGGVHPAQHHIDPFEGAERPHPQLAVADHQVGALHQREAQHARQVGLVECGLGVNAGAEDHDDRLLGGFGRGVDERQSKRLRPRRRRARTDLLVEIGCGVCDDAPIGKCVARAGRRLRPVGVDSEHPVAANG